MSDGELVRKHINVTAEQAEEIDERNLNLSGFVRDALREWSDRE